MWVVLDIPRPIPTFEASGFPDYLLYELRKAGFKGPTPIQSQGWPMALSGRDMIGVSNMLARLVHVSHQYPVVC